MKEELIAPFSKGERTSHRRRRRRPEPKLTNAEITFRFQVFHRLQDTGTWLFLVVDRDGRDLVQE